MSRENRLLSPYPLLQFYEHGHLGGELEINDAVRREVIQKWQKMMKCSTRLIENTIPHQ